MFFTYILYSILSIDFILDKCEDIAKRLSYHNSGNVKSTKPFIPWDLIGFIEKPTRSEAIILERKLKNLNTEDLKKFILKYFKKSFQHGSMAR